MSDYQCINLSSNHDVAVVRLVDDRVMDAGRIAMLGEELLSLASTHSGGKVLINLENVRFLSSSALNKLIVLEKRLSGNGGYLKLANLRHEVAEVFHITQLDTVFDIRSTEKQAFKAFDDEDEAPVRPGS